MTERQKERIRRAGPYVSLSNLIAMLGLIVVLAFNYFGASQKLTRRVGANASQIQVNTTQIANMKKKNGWQDVRIARTSKHTDKKLQILDDKVSHVLDLMLKMERGKH
jgi:hypothetical protein